MSRFIHIIITTIIAGFVGMLFGAMPAQAADDAIIGEPIEDVALGYNPGLSLTRVCTFVSTPKSAKLTSATLSGKFNNRDSSEEMGYEASLVDAYSQELAGAYSYVSAGSRSDSFVIVPKGTPITDDRMFLTVRANDSEFAYYDFTAETLCKEFYVNSVKAGKVRFTYTATCLVQIPVKADELCATTSTSVRVKNLGKKSTKLTISSAHVEDTEAWANEGPTKNVTIKSGKSSRAISLIRHTVYKHWCYLGSCSVNNGSLSTFDIVNKNASVSGIWWTPNAVPWTGLLVPAEDL